MNSNFLVQHVRASRYCHPQLTFYPPHAPLSQQCSRTLDFLHSLSHFCTCSLLRIPFLNPSSLPNTYLSSKVRLTWYLLSDAFPGLASLCFPPSLPFVRVNSALPVAESHSMETYLCGGGYYFISCLSKSQSPRHNCEPQKQRICLIHFVHTQGPREHLSHLAPNIQRSLEHRHEIHSFSCVCFLCRIFASQGLCYRNKTLPIKLHNETSVLM